MELTNWLQVLQEMMQLIVFHKLNIYQRCLEKKRKGKKRKVTNGMFKQDICDIRSDPLALLICTSKANFNTGFLKKVLNS